MTCTPLILALSLGSLHFGGHREYRDENLGMSVQCSHFEAGGYKNSVNRQSYFVGYHANHVMAGFVSGYRPVPVPYVAGYYDFGPLEIVGLPLVEKTGSLPSGVVISLRLRFGE